MSKIESERNIVAAVTDHNTDKYSLLEKVLELSRFFEILDERRENSGKPKKDFKIVIKPNISMMLRRSDVGTYTDPFLVIHLLRLLLKRGYENLSVVESQNLYGNWFENRGVLQVAARAGYFEETKLPSFQNQTRADIWVKGGGIEAKVPLIDMTFEAVPCDFGGQAGKVLVGKAWIEADFRINFAKLKSHFYSCYTLAIKNIYGCLPLQDKVREYHCRHVVGPWTAHLIKTFPVHFSIGDGYSSADGWLGVKIKAIGIKPHTIIAGADIMAVDDFGAKLIKIDPEKSIMFSELKRLIPLRPYQVAGNASWPQPWRNSPYFIARFCILLESSASLMDYTGSLATGGYDPCFPHKKASKGLIKRLLYYLTVPVNFLSDLGIAKLRIREKFFARKLKKYKEKLPVIASSDFLLSRLAFLGVEELEKLASFLKKGLEGQPSLSGHYIVCNNREFVFPSRLTTANLAVKDILVQIQNQRLDVKALVNELEIIEKLYPSLFGGDNKYSYCYR